MKKNPQGDLEKIARIQGLCTEIARVLFDDPSAELHVTSEKGGLLFAFESARFSGSMRIMPKKARELSAKEISGLLAYFERIDGGSIESD